MSLGVQVTMDVIVHATEDAGRIYGAFEETFGINRDAFKARKAEGHFDNPILMLRVRVSNDAAARVLERISSGLSRRERDEVADTLGERASGSGLYLRIGKQELVRGRIVLEEEDAVRIRIHRASYAKGDAVAQYADLLKLQLN